MLILVGFIPGCCVKLIFVHIHLVLHKFRILYFDRWLKLIEYSQVVYSLVWASQYFKITLHYLPTV